MAVMLVLCLTFGVSAAFAEYFPTELDDRIAEEGMWITWRVDEINDFYQELGFSAPVLAEGGAGQISRDEAIRIAREFILQTVDSVCPQYFEQSGLPAQPMSEELMNSLKAAAFLTGLDENSYEPNCWHVHLYQDEWLTVSLDSFDVRIDAATGEIIMFFEPGGNG